MPTAQNILVICGSADFSAPGDLALEDRLTTTLGHTLDIRDGDGDPAGSTSITAADVEGWVAGDDMIFMSSSTVLDSTNGGVFATVASGVMHCEGHNFEEDLLALAGSSGETSSSYTTIDILDPSHPCAGGLSGTVTFTTTAYRLNYCHVDALPAGAVSIASVPGDPDRICLYVIETGDALADGSAAPARRCCFPATYSSPAVAHSNFWALFDACVDWTGNPDTAVTPSGTSVGGSNDEGSLYAVDSTATRPVIAVEIAFGIDAETVPTDGQWSAGDVTSDVRISDGISYSRGRSGDLARMEPGRASFTLSNRDRQYEPGWSGGSNYPHVRPRAWVRITSTWYGRTIVNFTGYVSSWSPSYPGAMSDAVCRVECIDAYGIAARTKVDGGHLTDIITGAASPAAHYPLDETAGTTYRETLRSGPTITNTTATPGDHPLLATAGSGTGISRAQHMKLETGTSMLQPSNIDVETAGVLTLAWWMKEDLDSPSIGTVAHDVRKSDSSEYSWIVSISQGIGGTVPTATFGTLTETEEGTICEPAVGTHESGDLLVACFVWDGSSASSATPTEPAGWDRVGAILDSNDGSLTAYMAIYTRVATSAAETISFSTTNNEDIVGGVVVVKNAGTDIHLSTLEVNDSETSPAVGPTEIENCLILRFVGADGSDAPFTWAAGPTERWDEETIASGVAITAAEDTQVEKGTSPAVAVTYNSTPPNRSLFATLAIAGSVGGAVTYDHHSDGTGATLTVASQTDLMDGESHFFTLTRSADANTIKCYVDGVLAGSGTHTETSAPSTDTTCSFAWGWNFTGWVGGLTVLHEELSDVDISELYDAGRDVFSRESTDGRISKLLQYLGTPASLKSLDAGASTMPSEDLHLRTVSDALDEATAAELGTLFVDGSGSWRFHSRARRKATNPTLSIGEGSVLPLSDLTLTNPDNSAATVIVVNVEGQQSASAIDLVQVAELGEITGGPSGALKVTSTSLAKSYAQHLLAQQSTGDQLRVDEVVLKPTFDAGNMFAPLLDVEIGDRISVAVDPISSSPTADIAFDGFVESLSVTTNETDWTVSLRLSPEALSIVTF